VTVTRSSDEVRADFIAKMGQDLGEVFAVLSYELTMLSWQFQELSELYGGEQRAELMNAAAPFFFWLLQRTWWDESLLGITRLVAPKQSMGRTNLTIQQFPELIADAQLRERVEKRVADVVGRADFAKAWRNKRIAHRDLEHSLDRAPEPLPPAGLEDVGGVLKDIGALLNEIESHYCNSTTLYEKLPITHGALSLLYVIRDGLRREEIRQKKLEKNEYNPEDWDNDAPAL